MNYWLTIYLQSHKYLIPIRYAKLRPTQHQKCSVCVCVCVLLNRVQLSATPWTVALQALLSMEFSKQEYWSG